MIRVFQSGRDIILIGDVQEAIKIIPYGLVDMVITSPPYYHRTPFNVIVEWPDGWVGELGQEDSLKDYAEHLAYIFDLIGDKIEDCVPVFINLDDTIEGKRITFSGKHIDVSGEVIRAFERHGWTLKRKFVLVKSYIYKGEFVNLYNRRFPNHSYEFMLMFTRGEDCSFDCNIQTDVIGVSYSPVTSPPFSNMRFSKSFVDVFIENFSEKGDVILDPFAGSGTTGVVARMLGRHFILIDYNDYVLDEFPEMTGRKKRVKL